MLRLNTNIPAIQAHRFVSKAEKLVSKATEALSSGLRINRASDDAAGLSISETLRGQIQGLVQAERNIQDGVSLVNVADGALTEVHAILDRMRELAVQSANGSYGVEDRQAIAAEFGQLKNGITDISAQTKFNGLYLFQGQGSAFVLDANMVSVTTQFNDRVMSNMEQFAVAGLPIVAGNTVATVIGSPQVYGLGGPGPESIVVKVEDSGAGTFRTIAFDPTHTNGYDYNVATQEVTLYGAANPVGAEDRVDVAYVDELAITLLDPAIVGSQAVDLGGPLLTEGVDYVMTNQSTVTFIGNGRPDAWPGAGAFSVTTGVVNSTPMGQTTFALPMPNPLYPGAALLSVDVNVSTYGFGVGGGPLAGPPPSTLVGTDYSLLLTQVGQVAQTPLYTASFRIDNDTLFALTGIGGHNIQVNYTYTYPTVVAPLQIDIQSGANQGEIESVIIDLMTVNSIGVGTSLVDTQPNAQAAIADVDAAIESISSLRSRLGANANQLTFTSNAVTSASVNQAAAFSRIRDTDFAETYGELTRAQILSQAAMSMLAQANAAPSMLSSLLP